MSGSEFGPRAIRLLHPRSVVTLMKQLDGPADDFASSAPDDNFSPSRALEAVGERWSLRIFREAMFSRVTTFAGFLAAVGAEADILSSRLSGFVGAGLMETRRDADTGETHYALTENGRNLEPVIIALIAWSDGWDAAQAARTATFPEYREVAARIVETQPLVPVTGAAPLVIAISVLGAFGLKVGGIPVAPLAVGSQRLLVFLALHDRAVARVAMAGAMWPEASDERAGISLRSALSRLDAATHDAISSASAGLRLADTVAVDLRDAQGLARRLLQKGVRPREDDLSHAAVETLSQELLPDWYDDWVIAEAEDWRQLRMHALEAQATELVSMGRLADAAGAARAAMKVEPLRESAHACLIRVHIAEGNQSEALRVYDRYCALLRDVLDLEPTPAFSQLVAPLLKA